jgi:hypothetical protein
MPTVLPQRRMLPKPRTEKESCLSAFRYQLSPSMRASVLGFRVVVELSDANESINDARPTTAE